MPDYRIAPVDPFRLISLGEEESFPPGIAARCLAQGDSWFSLGAFPPGVTTNIVDALVLSKATAVVNCARPGKHLRRMVDTMRDPQFMRLLSHRKLAVEFDAILISGGGNDLIAALNVLPEQAGNRSQQLLLDPAARGGIKVEVDSYLSLPGWEAFCKHIAFWFANLIVARDRSLNRGKPLFLHNYAYCMPRPAGAGFGMGPWLHRAMESYSIPPEDRFPVARKLMDALDILLVTVVAKHLEQDPACNVHLVDGKGQAGLELAEAGSDGESGDWINEIHPNYRGYRKLAQVWRQALDPVL